MKSQVIPVVIGAIGTISKSLRLYLSNKRGKHEIKEMQKNKHIGLRTHTVGSANVQVQNIFHGRNNITCSMNCEYRRAATLYTVESWLVSGYIMVYNGIYPA